MSAHIDNQPAFVLHTRPYRETSLLVDLLTLDYGRISVVARGARRPNAQLRHTLQSFSLLAISFRGRGDLRTLSAAETAELLPMLKGDALLCALYANELLQRLLKPFDAFSALFLDYQTLLNELSGTTDLERALRSFERRLLTHLGAWQPLDRLDEGQYRYVEGRGLIRDESVGKTDELLFPAELLRAVEAEAYDHVGVKKVAKLLMRRMLGELLDGRPLRSRALFERRTPCPSKKPMINPQEKPE